MTSPQQSTATATVTTPAEREIRIERIFDAPRERVFGVFTDPELDLGVVGPARHDDDRRRDDAHDRRPLALRVPRRRRLGDGFRGAYREVTPHDRIVQTFEWEGMPGHVSVETAEFEDLGERTRVVTTSVFHTTEERDGMLHSGMEGGMNETYQRLDELLARLGG